MTRKSKLPPLLSLSSLRVLGGFSLSLSFGSPMSKKRRRGASPDLYLCELRLLLLFRNEILYLRRPAHICHRGRPFNAEPLSAPSQRQDMGNNKKRRWWKRDSWPAEMGVICCGPFLWPKFAKFVVSAIALLLGCLHCDSAEFYCGLSSAVVSAIFIHLFPYHASNKFLSPE